MYKRRADLCTPQAKHSDRRVRPSQISDLKFQIPTSEGAKRRHLSVGSYFRFDGFDRVSIVRLG